MSTNSLLRSWIVALMLFVVPAGLVLAAPATSRAQDAKAGPFAIKNTSGQAFKLSNPVYTDRYGKEKTMSGFWEIKPKDFSVLNFNGEKIVASKVKMDLITDAGKTTVTWVCKTLDKDGDFVCSLSADDIATHLKQLGKAPPVVALKAPAGPTKKQTEDGVLKALGAVAFHIGAKEILDSPNADLGDAFIAAGLITARDNLIGSAVGDLFPQLTAKESAGVRRMVILAFDDKLTPANLTALERKEKLKADLKALSPDLGAAAEVADFLSGIEQNRKK